LTKAEVLVREKGTDDHGNLYELVVWKVSRTFRHPQGVRYRLAFVRAGEGKPIVLYDNHHPKGHHRHLEGQENPYGFVDVDRLIADFIADVRRILGST
jgi:uncharacterized protein DUF6516